MTVTALEMASFASLADLQERHARLVREAAGDVLRQDNLERIKEFVHRSVLTGSILDASADRTAAQGLITFWTARVASNLRVSARKHPAAADASTQDEPLLESDFKDTLLAEFDPELLRAKVIEPANRWWARQPELEQTLTRRMLLRLIRLREKDDVVEVRSSAAGVCDGLEPHENAEQVLKDLITLGVVRTVRTDDASDEVALHSPALLKQWPLMQEWIVGRKAFRKTALSWASRRLGKEKSREGISSWGRQMEAKLREGLDKVGSGIDFSARWVRERLGFRQPSEEILPPEAFEEAETYRDRIPEELKLTYQKRLSDKVRNERRQALWVGLSGVSVVLLVLVFWARHQQRVAETQSEEAKTQKGIAEAQTLKAEEKSAELKRLTQYVEHQAYAESGRPQRDLLHTFEALQIAKSGKLEDRSSKAEERLREALANIGGVGFYADLGVVTHVAAHEYVTAEKKDELRWLAAAGTNGSIALWDLQKGKKQNPEMLSFGYAPPIRSLFITKDACLVAVNFRNNISRWDLNEKDHPCRVMEVYSQLNNLRLNTTPTGDWLAFDDGISKVCLVHTGRGKRGFQKMEFDLNKDLPESAKNRRLLPNYSFSLDERWFAIFTPAGDAIVWNLHEEAPRPRWLAAGKEGPSWYAINGEFLDDSNRLVIFFTNGTARYWHWNQKESKWNASDVTLTEKESLKNARIVTDRRGTHAILIPQVDSTKGMANRPPSIAEAYCFDANNHRGEASEAKAPQLKILTAFDEHYLSGKPESDETGRWLVAKFSPDGVRRNPYLRIWDLHSTNPAGIAPRMSPDGTQVSLEPRPIGPYSSIAMSASDNTIRLLDLKANAWRQLRGYESSVRILAQSQHGRFLASGAGDGAVRVWNLNPLSLSTEPFVYQAASTRSMLITPNRRWLVVSLPDGALRFRRIAEGAITAGEKDAFRYSAEGRAEASIAGPGGGTGQIADVLYASAKELMQPAELVPSDNGDWLLERRKVGPQRDLRTLDQPCYLWDVRKALPVRVGRLEVGEDLIQGVFASNVWLAVQTSKNFQSLISIWPVSELAKIESAKRIPGIPGELIGFDPSGAKLLVLANQKIDWWIPSLDRPEKNVYTAAERITFAKSTPDSRQLIISEYEKTTPDNPNTTHVIDLSTNARRKLSFFDPLESIFLSIDGKYICSTEKRSLPGKAEERSFPRFWRLEVDSDLSAHDFQANRLSKGSRVLDQSSDHRWLVTLEEDSGFLWDLTKKFNDLLKPKALGKIQNARFTPENAWLVTGAENGELTIHDLKVSGTAAAETIADSGFLGVIQSAAMSPDGKLALVAQKGLIHTWDLARPKQKKILPPGPVPGYPTQVLFSKDGTRLFSLFMNAVRVSYLQFEELRTKAAEATGRNLSESEWKRMESVEPHATFPELPVPASPKQALIPYTPLQGKTPASGPVEAIEIELKAKQAQKEGQLTSENYQMASIPGIGSGPGLAYSVRLPPNTTCQVDLTSPTFLGLLRLEDASRKTIATATAVGERTRMVFNTGNEAATYYITVIGRYGKPGPFVLRIEHQ